MKSWNAFPGILIVNAFGTLFPPQDITIRRLEDQIAGYEEGAEAKLEEEAAARARELQDVSTLFFFFFLYSSGRWVKIKNAMAVFDENEEFLMMLVWCQTHES